MIGVLLVVKTIVLFDNYSLYKGYRVQRGLSIYIEYDDKYLLFDLGSNSDTLQYNVEKLGIDIDMVDAVIISHNHANHIGGLPLIGWSAPYIKVYIPYDTLSTLGKIARSNGLIPQEITAWTKLFEGIYVSRPIHGPPWEHFLVLETDKGLIVYSGCMHPGVSRTLGIIREYFGEEEIYAVIGGFHLENALPETIESSAIDLVEKYGVKKIIPLHCSGKVFKELLRNRYSDKYIEAGVGSTINI